MGNGDFSVLVVYNQIQIRFRALITFPSLDDRGLVQVVICCGQTTKVGSIMGGQIIVYSFGDFWAAIAQWIRMLLSSCSPMFESQA